MYKTDGDIQSVKLYGKWTDFYGTNVSELISLKQGLKFKFGGLIMKLFYPQ